MRKKKTNFFFFAVFLKKLKASSVQKKFFEWKNSKQLVFLVQRKIEYFIKYSFRIIMIRHFINFFCQNFSLHSLFKNFKFFIFEFFFFNDLKRYIFMDQCPN